MYVHTDINTNDCVCGEKENERRVNKLIFGMKAQANGSKASTTSKQRISWEIAPISFNSSVV